MKLAIDGTAIEYQSTSIGIFQLNIIQGIVRSLRIPDIHILTTDAGSRYLSDNAPAQIIRVQRSPFPIRMFRAAKELHRIRPDVFYETFNISPILPSETKLVLQVHDFSHSNQDNVSPFDLGAKIYPILLKASLKRSTIVLGNSNYTITQTRGLVEHTKEVRTVYHDCDPLFKDGPPKDSDKPCGLDRKLGNEKYVLYVGRVAPAYKNLLALLVAFKVLLRRGLRMKLVVVSNDAFRSREAQYLTVSKVPIIHYRNIARASVKWLYAHADMLVYPSLYEGFGLPILEAQNSLCPVVAVDRPPMNEVGGAGVLYFDGSAEDLARKIEQIVVDSNLRRQLIVRGVNNARRFNWKSTVDYTCQAIADAYTNG